ncbi:hypothetical protein [Streptomyces sp. NPDC046727]|uniref:hypothetical protein n=1 Tax=Streptomyces sp. NPDC046727 TaxID=3155373 RepID=UPI0033D9CA56
MTPRLRLTFRCLRLLVVLTAATLPAYGTAVAHGSPPPYTTEPGPVRPPAVGHGEERPGPTREAAPRHPIPGRGHPQQAPPGPGHPGRTQSPGTGFAPPDSPAALPIPSDSASASVRPYRPLASTEPSRAGSRAGEGRMRPGRPDGPAADVEGDDDSTSATPAAQPAEPETTVVPGASEPPEEAGLGSATTPPQPTAQQAAQQGEAPTEPVLQILPLGSGLVLIGLGLGLALLGLRLRRD